ncbi:MAG TPA: DoxX family membrane protein [Blastocatellia bacterium]|nr:DoxX family membrane protein [Blastocatellia bacterium]
MSSRRSVPSYNRDPQPSRWLAVLRIYTGCWFLWLGVSKILNGFISNFPHLIIEYANRPLFVFYQSFLTNVVTPNAQVFAITIVVVEILIGLLLILGFLNRLTTLIALVLTVNYFLALAKDGMIFLALTLTGIIVVLVLLGSAAGRVWGMDASLYRRTLFKYFT